MVISSRSKSVSAPARRLSLRGRNPPVARTTKRIELSIFYSHPPNLLKVKGWKPHDLQIQARGVHQERGPTN